MKNAAVTIKDYVEATAPLPVGNTLLTLRPISMADVAKLRDKHGARFFAVASRYADDLRSDCGNRRHRAMICAAMDLVDLIADLIAFSAGAPDLADTARRLPIGLQISALVEISRLSRADLVFCDFERGFTEILELALIGPDPAEVVH